MIYMPYTQRQKLTEEVGLRIHDKFMRFFEKYTRTRNVNNSKRVSQVKVPMVTVIANRNIQGIYEGNRRAVWEHVTKYAVGKNYRSIVLKKESELLQMARGISEAEELKVKRFLIAMYSESLAILENIHRYHPK